MRSFLRGLVFASIFLIVLPSAFSQTTYRNYQDGKIYLKLKNNVAVNLPEYDAKHPVKYPNEFVKIIRKYSITSIRKAFPHLNTEDLNHTYTIQFYQQAKVEELIKALQKINDVDYAEKVPLYKVKLTPNDPSYGNQYALPKISAPSAWGLYTGNHNIKVAVVDNAVMVTHADLNANKWINPGEIPNNGIDDDGDGYVDDINGYDVADNDNNPAPPVASASPTYFEHGTHCGGIADAVGNNNTGIASIGFNLSLIGVKCEPDNTSNPDQLTYAIQGVEYAIAANADVVSMSWGGGGFSQTEQNVFNAGWAQGIIFCAAAGNDGTDETFYPAQYTNVLAVGSTGSGDVISNFSNYGAWIGVMAPGENIYSTLPGTNGGSSYGNLSGTSMATPCVAGLCGLMKSYSPSSTNAQIIACLESGCDNINAANPGYAGLLGAGRINAYAAMQCLVTIPVTDFTADVTQTCSGLVHFTDLTSGTPTSWLWNFGDGGTSTLENPTHQYLSAGTFSVSLKATNSLGNNTNTKTNYITDNQPAGPTAPNVSHCGAGTFSLSATTTNHVDWQDSTGVVVSMLNPFVTPSLTHNTTYWVQDTIPNANANVGPVSNTALSTTGGYFSNSTDRYLTFDAIAAFTLVNVTAYAQGAGSRTIELRNSGGTVLQSATVNMAAGANIVTLNFNVPVGTNYELGINGTANLYRNNDGGNINYYPFTLAGVVSITGSNAGAGYYYYFYNWAVQSGYCLSQTTPVTAIVNPSIVLGTCSVTAASCYGSANGSATISVTSGTPNYIYHWSNGQTSATDSNLVAGSYIVTVTDANGCSATAGKTVMEPTAINISVTPTNAGCIANGSAIANVSGGTAGYNYAWSNNDTNDTISSLATGTYTLTVTDSGLCTATASTVINSTGAISLNTSSTNVNCYGAATGSASVTETGGLGNITYSWSNGGTTSTINNLASATYTVTVNGAGGCSATASQVVLQPTALTVSVTPSDATCGLANGTATANISGGTINYTYNWSNGGSGIGLFNLPAGPISITVTDSHTCTATANATINSVPLLFATVSSVNESCFGTSTGSATANVISGTAPFIYAWSNGGSNSSINNIAAGTYYVTITDGNNCPQLDTVIVSQPTAVTLTLNTIDPACNGANDGSATVNAAGGTPSYTYTWFNNSANDSISNLSYGNYDVTAFDANSCSVTEHFTLTDPSEVTAVISSVNDSCYGDRKGSAIVTPGGGSGTYTYLWSNNNTANNISNLASGNYSVTVNDTHNCSVTAGTTISQPAPLQVYASSDDDDGTGDGSAMIDSITGGSGHYSIIWSNSQSGNEATGLTSGTYTVTVTDNNGCEQTDTVVVNLNLATGVNKGPGGLSFNVYPNPAKTEITVQLNYNSNKETSLMLQNVLGQTLNTTTISASLNKMDVSSLAAGVYFIMLKQADKIATKKFVVSR